MTSDPLLLAVVKVLITLISLDAQIVTTKTVCGNPLDYYVSVGYKICVSISPALISIQVMYGFHVQCSSLCKV